MNDEYEAEARTRSEGLEALGKLPPGFTQQHYPLTPGEHAELRRLKAALALAEGPDDFLAIVRSGKVPRRWYEQRLQQILRRR